PPWPYLTLSYCWGKQHVSVGTTKENFPGRTRSIPTESLPKTIQDAITITRRMGVRFLWVDVLCIIQPTELDNSDWVQESARMGDYFKGSLFTIAAATASDSAEGCLFSRKGLRFPQRSLNPCLPSAHHVVDQSPLFTRGWVLQELLLSTRVVFWTKDVLYWNCSEKFVSEHGYDCNRFGVYASRWSSEMQLMRNQPCPDRESALVRWNLVVQRFSSMNLSYPRDTLPAISAIAKGIQAIFQDDYLAGHWRESLVESLAWVSTEKPGAVTREVGYHWEPENYVAPSWSWASVSS
ncbi:heterokaryon incompatibility protein-domain-containing protein, partial [Tricladium varicosporioides]